MKQPIIEYRRHGYVVSTKRARLDVDAVHAYLSGCYWLPGIPKKLVRRAMSNSLCIGLFTSDWQQIGFGRAITDAASFAYLCDVYVLKEYRGKGLGRWMVKSLLAHPALQGLRRIVLVTRDAHGLYEPLGFKPLSRPQGYMEIHQARVYG